MDEGGKDCAWVHAYLHRVEGDLENARYCTGRPASLRCRARSRFEYDSIAQALLAAEQ